MVRSLRDNAVPSTTVPVLLLARGGGVAELYYPADPPYESSGFEAGLSLTVPRRAHTATRLGNGLILVAGGYDESGVARTTAEIVNRFPERAARWQRP